MKIKRLWSSLRGHFGIVGLSGSAFALTALLAAGCSDPEPQATPIYRDIFSPKAVRLTFGSRSAGSGVDFTIDNINMRIFNADPLPYGTELDSAYLSMYLSNQLPMTLTNAETGVQDWLPGDTAKISVKGGRLTLAVNRAEHPSLTYDFRIRSYGYDPDKLTWTNLGADLIPAAADTGRAFETGGAYYYMTRKGSEAALYRLEMTPFRFVPVTEALLPPGINPATLLADHLGRLWAAADDGSVYFSTDLKGWTQSYAPTEGRVVSLLNDYAKADSPETTLSVITLNDDGGWFFRSMQSDPEGIFAAFGETVPVPEGFPVTDSHIYTYDISGTRHSSVFGGRTTAGLPAAKSFFSSDGLHWAETPFSTIAGSIPEVGGLYLRDANKEGRIILIGGEYDGKPSAAVKVSLDRGITWTELTEEQLPPAAFRPRTGAAGIMLRDAEGVDHVYVIGGLIGNLPSREVWHGYLDTAGGILNDFE